MGASKIVTVVHPDSRTRILLRSVLQNHGCEVLTDHSWSHLLSDSSGAVPAVILIDRSLIHQDVGDGLSILQRKWVDSEIVLLPGDLMTADTVTSTVTQLLAHVDRLLAMKTTREILSV
ncbi:MAG TPA: hypothetical protein VE981_07500 [Planctomycetota bacterium]|nr:hypothetical protein [Planctomycetota bacterium]